MVFSKDYKIAIKFLTGNKLQQRSAKLTNKLIDN